MYVSKHHDSKSRQMMPLPSVTAFRYLSIKMVKRFDQLLLRTNSESSTVWSRGLLLSVLPVFPPRTSRHYIYMHRHSYIYACMYYLHVNIFPNFVLTLPSSMHTYICEAPCVQVDPKPERASVDFGFKIIFSNFRRPPPFWIFLFFFSAVFVRACMRTCVYACARACTCFLLIRRIHAL